MLLATSSRLEGVSGGYFDPNNEALTVDDPVTAYARGFGVARYALDGDSARRLLEMSEAVLA